MKRLLLATLPLLFSSAALAQPDPNTMGMEQNPPAAPRLTLDTPESATSLFLEALRRDNEFDLMMAVSGARVGVYGSSEWHELRIRMYPLSEIAQMKIDTVEVAKRTETDATVIVTGHREFRTPQGVERTPPTKYTLPLRLETNLPLPGFMPDQKAWRVVPLSTNEVLGKILPGLPPLQLAATLALQDPQLLPYLRYQEGISRLKQLGLGALQFVQDYNEVYAFDDEGHERALLPYLKNDTLFLIPGTKGEKWHFNDNFSTKNMAAVAEVARTVLFYDGDAPQSDKLNFRFEGKTLLAFADGHVKAYSKDELQDILWTP